MWGVVHGSFRSVTPAPQAASVGLFDHKIHLNVPPKSALPMGGHVVFRRAKLPLLQLLVNSSVRLHI